MTSKIFFVDFDDTLLNNDQVKEKIRLKLTARYGQYFVAKFLNFHDLIRKKTGYVDFPATIEAMAEDFDKPRLKEELHRLFHNFDFKSCLFMGAEKVLRYLARFGQVVIITEGDSHYQTVKIKSSGIWHEVAGRVEIPLKNKVGALGDIMRKYPAKAYYFIEDKPQILKEIKNLYADRIKTIHICQGHYSPICKKERFDLTVSSLSELLNFSFLLQT